MLVMLSQTFDCCCQNYWKVHSLLSACSIPVAASSTRAKKDFTN